MPPWQPKTQTQMTHFPLPLNYVEIEIEKFSEADALPLPSWDNVRF